MKTTFKIALTGFQDTDLPLSYQLIIYLSYDLYIYDVIHSIEYNQNILTDFQSEYTFQVQLPSGMGDNYQLVVMGRVSDALGGIQNVTQQI